MTKRRYFPRKHHKQLLDFIWVHKQLYRETGDLYFHVDDLVLLSDFDDLEFEAVAACNQILASSVYPSVKSVLELKDLQKAVSSWFVKLKPSHDNTKLQLPTSKYQPPSNVLVTIINTVNATLTCGILLIPVFMLLWIQMTRLWTATTVSMSMLIFASLMGRLPKVKTQDVLIGTAG